ncbi:acetolactate decarboxylase [Oecophyllibacter saccharovorans]|uniref:Alpha-acetolactate decarboxylase n=1 Tax=Oecophyllibacter saccharovorans TaxID=2558360 RepID=A0A506UR16_9PROT|nr:acetolactate decarboxylase [Oecophyllibacter saccharovorans]QDH14657.1 acetolactate decarboxylase [Oecophyllibacter saccharovorans]TPW34858.1 acetolactate decarboxylase [Oecophyllibacter saccharovorans]TPW35795.1 acetolactate decarboxylase [Oecophyllibacter saccharovorans]
MTTHHPKNRLFQTSTMAALLDAVYDGDMTVKELLTHGNFGLGTFNGLDGEMIVEDGIAHQFRADGLASDASGNLKTPFACVTWFEPEKTVTIDGPCTREEFEHRVNELIDNPNLFAGIRFTGHFNKVETRTVFCQHKPYPPLLEVVANQPTFTMTDMNGVMLGFRTPPYMQGINVAGFHLHFLSENQKHGGHVTEYLLGAGKLEVARISELDLSLPLTKAFAEADLQPVGLNEAIRTAEGG